MKRRRLLQTAAAIGALAAPGLATAQGSKVLRFVPQAGLSGMDAVAGTQSVVRNAALLVWDTLYGVNARLEPQPQMCEGHEVDAEFKTWSFRLRPGLKFHDGTPVLSRDVIASLKRWMARDTMGQQIAARLIALEAPDDRSFRFRLNRPFSKLLYALGKSNAPMALIMPERIARTDPFQPIGEVVGSGPMKFNRGEWVPGARAVFDRFADYPARPEAGEWLAGGKRMMLDRIEWLSMDPASAGAALQNGEVDWWETPLPELVPLLKRNRNIAVDIADPLGNIGSLRMNHQQPPFNDVRVRRALLMALSQQDYMQAVVGENPDLWRPLPSFFTPGTAVYSEEGGDILKGPRDIAGARQVLADSGQLGARVTLLAATDLPIVKAQAEITRDLLGRLGFAVDYVATDAGTVAVRRTRKDPPGQGGWNIFLTWHAGADCVNPAPYPALDAGGDKAWIGWPNAPEVQARIAEWYAAADLAAEKKAIAALNRASFDNVTFAPTGFFQMYQAWRSSVSGVARAPFPAFWGVQKS